MEIMVLSIMSNYYLDLRETDNLTTNAGIFILGDSQTLLKMLNQPPVYRSVKYLGAHLKEIFDYILSQHRM